MERWREREERVMGREREIRSKRKEQEPKGE
jgi:hypothetical protein